MGGKFQEFINGLDKRAIYNGEDLKTFFTASNETGMLEALMSQNGWVHIVLRGGLRVDEWHYFDSSLIKSYPNGFIRESEDDRATFDHIAFGEWEALGGGKPISAAPDDCEIGEEAAISRYSLFIDGEEVEPYLDRNFIAEMELLMHRGARKYSRDNWKRGCPPARAFNAAIRHIIQAFNGAGGENHAAAAAINAMFMDWTARMGELGDDEYAEIG